MEKTVLTRNQIITELTKSVHGRLDSYLKVGQLAAAREPEFLAHLIAWDAKKGQVKDSKVALPVISMATGDFPEELVDNSLAHLASLDPRLYLKAFRAAKTLGATSRTRKRMIALTRAYLARFEKSPSLFDAVAVQHRNALIELYSLSKMRPNARARAVLFREDESGRKVPYPKGSVFEIIPQLKAMAPAEAAGFIIKHKIPTLVVLGALGDRLKNTDLAMALIDQMSATELVTNAKLLDQVGVNDNPVLKAAFTAALNKAKSSKKATLKTSKAVDGVKSEKMKNQLRDLQEGQLQNLKGIEGNWLVLGDKSGSMGQAIEGARQVAATLAKLVRGNVYLVFFDTHPTHFNVTGMDYDKILKATKYVSAGGGTSIGCGLMYAIEKKFEIDGIAVVSDGGENAAPFFSHVYAPWVQSTGKATPVYFYRFSGDSNTFTRSMSQFGVEEFNLSGVEEDSYGRIVKRGHPIDYYSLPNLVQTMRANRYSLVDEIMETPLLTLNEVLNG